MRNFGDSHNLHCVALDLGPLRETTPLLRNNDETERVEVILQRVWICSISLFLVAGVSMAMYLIILQNTQSLGTIGYYQLVPYEEWSLQSISNNIPEMDLPSANIMLFQTNSSRCYNEDECSRILNDIQLQHMLLYNQTNIAYNFLLAGNKVIYEGRGWKYKPLVRDFPYRRVLSLTFIGNFDFELPTRSQIEDAEALLDHGLKRGLISKCCNVLFHKNPYNHYLLDTSIEIEKHIKRKYQCLKSIERSPI